jgi:DNA invertase Pin-like site-specific DNA recombinase
MTPNLKLNKKSVNHQTLTEAIVLSGDRARCADQDALTLPFPHGSENSLARTPIPAAQYLRMSTLQQRLSIESQVQVIEWYAYNNNFRVVQTYMDTGKSGISLNRREGLKRLLQDVFSDKKAYKAILVYDVSRWGRFQDPDEAAHYEYICKNAGVPVYYCAETFSNESNLPNAVMKALKRAMAGEYSRELSVRTERAKRIVAERGFRAGGAPGFGLRRMLLASDGVAKRLLERGEITSISDSRVILVHGPRREVATVREIYRLAVCERKNTYAIARELNRRRLRPPGKYASWTNEPILEILTNQKYMGDAVYGRTTHLLGNSRLLSVPRAKWIVRPGAFKPIVDSQTFAAAQRMLHDRTYYRSDEELLDRLRALLKREGPLTGHRIDASREVPVVRTFVERFGSMKRAYDLVGYVYPEHPLSLPSVRKLMWKTRRLHERLRNKLLIKICKLFPGETVVHRKQPFGRPVLRFRDGLSVAAVIVPSTKTPLGKIRWTVPALRAAGSNVTLLCRCNAMGDAFHDLYLIPSVDRHTCERISENHACLENGKRVDRLSHLKRLAVLVATQNEDHSVTPPTLQSSYTINTSERGV